MATRISTIVIHDHWSGDRALVGSLPGEGGIRVPDDSPGCPVDGDRPAMLAVRIGSGAMQVERGALVGVGRSVTMERDRRERRRILWRGEVWSVGLPEVRNCHVDGRQHGRARRNSAGRRCSRPRESACGCCRGNVTITLAWSDSASRAGPTPARAIAPRDRRHRPGSASSPDVTWRLPRGSRSS